MKKIDSKDISVVVQGAISEKYTPEVLKSIRKYLPEAEIILSTWKNSDTANLDYDILVENTDPGAEILFPQWNQKHNLNRQILSAKNGIKKATRKYVLKTRTDISLKSANFLKYFGKFEKRCEKVKILKERVLICQNYVRFPNVFPFHISDWVQFGLKEDVENIWDIPLAPEPETTKWFYTHELLEQHKSIGPYSHFRHRYCAEQYIWSKFLIKNGINIKFEHMWDISYENILITKISFANNLVILSNQEFGIEFLKQKIGVDPDIYTYYTWQLLYKEFCDKKYTLSILKKILAEDKFRKYKSKTIKHYTNSVTMFKTGFRCISNTLSTIFYAVKLIIQFIKDILNIQCMNKSDRKYLNHMIKQLPANCKNINVLNLATGESYLFAILFDQLKDDDTIWCTGRKATYEIFEMFNPGKIIYFKELKQHYFFESEIKFKNKNIKIFISDKFWLDFWRTKDSFLNSLQMYLDKNINTNIKVTPSISEKDITTLNEKINKINLDENNFVFLSPEANSTNLLPAEFWQDITDYLKQNNIDVFCNVMDEKNKPDNAKSCFLTFKESYILAKKAKTIIALRSGFIEILSSVKTPMHIIYNIFNNTKNPNITNLYENYTLKNYPDISEQIYEYVNQDEKDLDIIKVEIINQINKNLCMKGILK